MVDSIEGEGVLITGGMNLQKYLYLRDEIVGLILSSVAAAEKRTK